MTNPTQRFFEDVARRGHEPMLERLSATVRWDLITGDRVEHRVITIDHGDLTVTVGHEPADCVIILERAVCDDVVTGRTSWLAAILRGAVAVEGNPELLILTQRLFMRVVSPVVDRHGGAEASPPS
jgi:SCP-2 sterol transfer family